MGQLTHAFPLPVLVIGFVGVTGAYAACVDHLSPVHEVTSADFNNVYGVIDGSIDNDNFKNTAALAPSDSCASPLFLTLDLGEVTLLSSVTVIHYHKDVRQYCNQSVALSHTRSFSGEESMVFACGTFAECGDATAEGQVVTLDTPQLARFVRVGSSRNNRNVGVHILEVEVMVAASCDVHASCSNTDESFTCTCNDGFVGNGVTCKCPDGYTHASDDMSWIVLEDECVDLEECVAGEHNCDEHAECTNTAGSFKCECNAGYTGTGVTCAVPLLLDCANVCTASQESTTHSGIAARAFDGEGLDGTFGSHGCTHTRGTPGVHAWWKADLGRLRSLSHLKVWNRDDNLLQAGTLTGFRIWIGVEDDIAKAGLCYTDDASPAANVTVAPCLGYGRYVWIELARAGLPLALCEVEIFHYHRDSDECAWKSDWEHCASEEGACTCWGQVRFGAQDHYAYLPAAGAVACNDGNFGDPLPGAEKECQCSTHHNYCPHVQCAIAAGSFTCSCEAGYIGDGLVCTVDEGRLSGETDVCGFDECEESSVWSPCAGEAHLCECWGQVRYGAHGRWVYGMHEAHGSVGCSNAVFGDPIGGVQKTCECAPASPTCRKNSKCKATASGPQCACTEGYMGDGVVCHEGETLLACPAHARARTVPGFRAQYFSDHELSVLEHTRVDRFVNVNYGAAGPGSDSLPSVMGSDAAAQGLPAVPGFTKRDYFSIRWTAEFHVMHSGVYQFRGGGNDGVRVLVDGATVLEHWQSIAVNQRFDRWSVPQFTLSSGSTELEAGWHAIVCEGYDGISFAEFRLEWQPPWASAWELMPGVVRTCECEAGYIGDGNVLCLEDDTPQAASECKQACGEHAACIGTTAGSFECACARGYTGDGLSCEDVDECEGSPCEGSTGCINTLGSFVCREPGQMDMAKYALTQTSAGGSGAAAVDGNLSSCVGVWAGAGVMPWWRVDLGGMVEVSAVEWAQRKELSSTDADWVARPFSQWAQPVAVRALAGAGASLEAAVQCGEARVVHGGTLQCPARARFLWLAFSAPTSLCDLQVWAPAPAPVAASLSPSPPGPACRNSACFHAGQPQTLRAFSLPGAEAVVSLWFRRDEEAGSAPQTLVELNGAAAPGREGELRVECQGAGAKCFACTFVCGQSATLARVEFASGEWVHLQWAMSLEEWRLWSNGVLVARVTAPTEMPVPGGEFGAASLGARLDGSQGFSGWIDDVRVYAGHVGLLDFGFSRCTGDEGCYDVEHCTRTWRYGDADFTFTCRCPQGMGGDGVGPKGCFEARWRFCSGEPDVCDCAGWARMTVDTGPTGPWTEAVWAGGEIACEHWNFGEASLHKTLSKDGECWCLDAVGTCSDGLQNGDEEGIDCGGAECAECSLLEGLCLHGQGVIQPDSFANAWAPGSSLTIPSRNEAVTFVVKATFPKPHFGVVPDGLLFEFGGANIGLWAGLLKNKLHIQYGSGTTPVVEGEVYEQTAYLISSCFPADGKTHTVVIDVRSSAHWGWKGIQAWIDRKPLGWGVPNSGSPSYWADDSEGTFGAQEASSVPVGTVTTGWPGTIISDLMAYRGWELDRCQTSSIVPHCGTCDFGHRNLDADGVDCGDVDTGWAAGPTEPEPAAEVPLANPGFEVNPTAGYWYRAPSGWQGKHTVVVRSGNGAWGGRTGDGNNYLVLQTNEAYVAQTVPGLTEGQLYVLRFLAASRPGYGTDEHLSVLVDGKRLLSTHPPDAGPFAEYEVEFTAGAEECTVRFNNDSPEGDRSVFVDAVSVQEVFSAGCPAGWRAAGPSCFRELQPARRALLSQEAAEQLCASELASLPILSSKAESDALWEAFGESWLGMVRASAGFEGQVDAWVWSDGAWLRKFGERAVVAGSEVGVNNGEMDVEAVEGGWEERAIPGWACKGRTYVVGQGSAVAGGMESGHGPGYAGLRSLGGFGASIAQEVGGLEVGRAYAVSFKAGCRAFFGHAPLLRVRVDSAGGQTLASEFLVGEKEDVRRYPGAYGALSNSSFEDVTVVFTAATRSATVRFETEDATSGDRMVLIDAVAIAEVTAVPASWQPIPGLDFLVDESECAVVVGGGSWRAVSCAGHTAHAVCQKPRFPQACRWDEVLVGDRCVWVHVAGQDDRKLDRAGASAACKSWGGTLLTIKHADDMAQARKMPRHTSAHIGLSRTSMHEAWLYESGYRMSELFADHMFYRSAVPRWQILNNESLCMYLTWSQLDYGIDGYTMLPHGCEQQSSTWLCEKPAHKRLPPFAAPKDSCADVGGFPDRGWCYWLAPLMHLAFHDAERACQGWGGHLAPAWSSAVFPPGLLQWEPTWIGAESLGADHAFSTTDASPADLGLHSTNDPAIMDAARGPLCATMAMYWTVSAAECDLLNPSFLCRRPADPLAPPPPPTTPALHIGDWSYTMLRTPMPFDAAAAACYEFGGWLTSVQSAKQDNVMQHFQTGRRWPFGGMLTVAQVGITQSWIGLRRQAGGEWAWAGGSAVVYTNWESGEPSGESGKDCAVDRVGGGGWVAERCDALVGSAVCARPREACAVAEEERAGWCRAELDGEGLEHATVLHSSCCGCCFFLEGDGAPLQRLGACDASCHAIAIAGAPFSLRDADAGSLFADIPDLRSLTLQGSSALDQVPAGLVAGMRSLQVLRLSQNALTRVPAELLAGLPKLRELDLSRNALAELPPSLLTETPRLRFLELRENEIQSLPPKLFEHTPWLTYLGLARNSLGLGGGLPCMVLPRLQTLLASSNRISSLTPQCLGGMPELRTLELNLNELVVIERRVLEGLGQLSKLLLQQNQLNEIEMAALDGLRSLRVLELWGNHLTRLPVGMTLMLAALESVSFYGNPLQCLPTLRRSQGSDLTDAQRQSLPECIPLGCPRHLEDAISFGSPQNNYRLGADLHARAVTELLHMLRSDALHLLDDANLAAGEYVGYAGGVRCWCVGKPACFMVHGSSKDRGREQYHGSAVRWFSEAQDDFVGGSAAQEQDGEVQEEVRGEDLSSDDGAALPVVAMAVAAAGVAALVGVALAVMRRRQGRARATPAMEMAELKGQLGHVPDGKELDAIREAAAWMLEGESRATLGFSEAPPQKAAQQQAAALHVKRRSEVDRSSSSGSAAIAGGDAGPPA